MAATRPSKTCLWSVSITCKHLEKSWRSRFEKDTARFCISVLIMSGANALYFAISDLYMSRPLSRRARAWSKKGLLTDRSASTETIRVSIWSENHVPDVFEACRLKWRATYSRSTGRFRASSFSIFFHTLSTKVDSPAAGTCTVELPRNADISPFENRKDRRSAAFCIHRSFSKIKWGIMKNSRLNKSSTVLPSRPLIDTSFQISHKSLFICCSRVGPPVDPVKSLTIKNRVRFTALEVPNNLKFTSKTVRSREK
mmetsp:Transcript_44320/g.115181  ORF Transcript_44320/g.115181 Transcript_44320/m.115181 type:complete len:255 (-) Transcript_44320:437-1201(-)